MRPARPVARAGQLRAGDQLSCRVAECRGDLGEVGGHGGGLDVGEGLEMAGGRNAGQSGTQRARRRPRGSQRGSSDHGR